MPLPINNNKESFRLLDLSTDLDSDDLHLEIASNKKKKVQRKGRSRGTTTTSGRITTGPADNGIPCFRCGYLRWAVCLCAISWLLTLTWLAAALHDRVTHLHTQLQTVSTSSGGVSEALQLCHSAAKELRANATSLDGRLALLATAHQNLEANVKETTAELRALQEKLAAAPELAETPRRLDELQQMVADFGSRLSGFNITLQTTRETAVSAARGLEELRTAVNESETRVNTSAAARELTEATRDAEITKGLVKLNATLGARLDQLVKRINDYATRLSATEQHESEAAVMLKELQALLNSTRWDVDTTTVSPSLLTTLTPQHKLIQSSASVEPSVPSPEAPAVPEVLSVPVDAAVPAASVPGTSTLTNATVQTPTKPTVLH